MSVELQSPYTQDLPHVFGRYLLLRRLSRGGMGEIFLARHGLTGFEKLCVIKKVLPHLAEDGDFITRFIDEAQVVIKLQHANVAQVFEVGRVGSEYFLSMEYVEGRDLRSIMRVLRDKGDRLQVHHALFIAREIAAGLAYAHRRKDARGGLLNIVHCDVSPPNVLLSFEGEVKLIDFGIAKSRLRATSTDPKLGFGKFGYMAPEQLVRGGKIDRRTDIYATGVVLFELLTGTRMFEPGDTPDYRMLARMVTRGEHPLPSHIDPALAQYDNLVSRALRPDPAERYQLAAELRDAIQAEMVKVAPTMTHDHLGAFMRVLYADEVTADRTAIAQAQQVDLSDFAAELSTASAGTVTFALGDMPLPAPPPTELIHRAPMPRSHGDRPRRRVGLYGAIAAGGLLAGVAAVAAMRGGGDAAVASAEPAPEPIVAIATADAAPAPPDAAPVIVEAIVVPDAAPERVATAPPRPPRKAKKPAPSPPPAADDIVSRDRVQAKLRAATREYTKYKGKYGARLEDEYTELMTLAQFAGDNPDKLAQLDRKIDAFRRKMK